VVSLDGGVLDGAVHPLDLPVGPPVVWLGEPVLDAMLAADLVEALDTQPSGGSIPVAWQAGELDAIVSQDGVQIVGHSFERGFHERDWGRPVSLLAQLGEGELSKCNRYRLEVGVASSVWTAAIIASSSAVSEIKHLNLLERPNPMTSFDNV